MKIILRLGVLFLFVTLFAPRVGAGVLTVPGQFPTVQAAVDAAADLDVVLITPGSYGGAVLIADKAVSLVADGGTVGLGYLVVRDLSPGRDVVLSGLTVSSTVLGLPAVHLKDDLGSVRIENCSFTGGGGFQPNGVTGRPGLWIESCASVNVSSTTLQGGSGADLVEELTDMPPGAGGPALLVRASLLTLTDSTLTGGDGGSIYDTVLFQGGLGAAALFNITSQVMVGGSTLTGGDGGNADCTFYACGGGGDAGEALHQQQPTASTWLRGNTLSTGLPGLDGDGQGTGWPGVVQWIEAGTVVNLPAAWRTLSGTSPVRENAVATLTIAGSSGDLAFLWASLGTGHLPLAGKQGVFLLGFPALLEHLPLGTIPVSGSLVLPLTIPELGPGIDAVNVHLQLVVQDGGGALLGPLTTLTLLDSAY